MIDLIVPLILVVIVSALVVNFFLSRSLRDLRQADRERLFPVTIGTVRVDKVERIANIDSSDNYRVVLVYDYIVDGRPYTGVYRTYATFIDSASVTPDQVESPDVGKQLDIAYDPARPGDSHVRD